MNSDPTPELKRTIGRWSLVALAVNSILGSAIFGLPSIIIAAVGPASPWAVLIAGLGIGVIMACYAEVAAQFDASGGTYLYARSAFGPLTGLLVGWLGLLARITACAAGANLLVTYLAEFWPVVTTAVPRFFALTVLLGMLVLVNYRGVEAGTRFSTFFTVAKLVPLALLSAIGLLYLLAHSTVHAVEVGGGLDGWRKALLVLFFAYGGLEAALNPMGEAKDPRRDAPFALLTGLAIVAVLYLILQLIVAGILPDAAHSPRPLAAVAATLLGPSGVVLITVGAVMSIYGYLSGQLLSTPRYVFALAETGDFPRALAAVHARYRSPHVAIVLFGALIWAFALPGSFAGNATLSAASRLFYYGVVCAAVPVLRKRQPAAAGFRAPGGPWLLPGLGVLVCIGVAAGVEHGHSLVLAGTVLLALANWLAVRRRAAATQPPRA